MHTHAVCADYASTDDNGNIAFHQLDEVPSGDPDPEAMAQSGDTGICVDMVYLYQQTCPIKPLSQTVSGIVGCFDTWASNFYCGMPVDRVGPDGTGVSVNLFDLVAYPRTLVTATPDLDGDYKSTPELKCYDVLDCVNKCRMLERTSRDGMGAPPPCMLCAARKIEPAPCGTHIALKSSRTPLPADATCRVPPTCCRP